MKSPAYCRYSVTEHPKAATPGHFKTGHPGGERGDYAHRRAAPQARLLDGLLLF